MTHEPAPLGTDRLERPPVWRLLTRALRLRCPHCGGSGIFAGFFALQPQCPGCGLRLERGEGDYFVGAYLFKSLHVTAALYVFFLGLALFGLRAWRAAAREPQAVPAR